HANMGTTLLYGIMIAIPTIIIAGPLFSRTLTKIKSTPLETFLPKHLSNENLPGSLNSFLTALLPILLFAITSLFLTFSITGPKGTAILEFLGEGSIVMLISLIVSTFTIGIGRGIKMKEIMTLYTEAVKDVVMIFLIIAGAGALKQILTDSGISETIAAQLQNVNIQPLILGWLIAAIIRICVGSSTVAGLTAAGIIAPLMIQTHTNPNLMVLSIGAGSLVFSHVNDSGFWLCKEYFNLSLKDTFRSWSMMETIVAVLGLGGVLLLKLFV
ncbi:MAG: gluconate transporter, partial [Flavisolibacter sp.]